MKGWSRRMPCRRRPGPPRPSRRCPRLLRRCPRLLRRCPRMPRRCPRMPRRCPRLQLRRRCRQERSRQRLRHLPRSYPPWQAHRLALPPHRSRPPWRCRLHPYPRLPPRRCSCCRLPRCCRRRTRCGPRYCHPQQRRSSRRHSSCSSHQRTRPTAPTAANVNYSYSEALLCD